MTIGTTSSLGGEDLLMICDVTYPGTLHSNLLFSFMKKYVHIGGRPWRCIRREIMAGT
jgi:hypothetical protein